MHCLGPHCSWRLAQRCRTTGVRRSSPDHTHLRALKQNVRSQPAVAGYRPSQDCPCPAGTPGHAVAAVLAAVMLQAAAVTGSMAQPLVTPSEQQEPQVQHMCTQERQPQADLAGLFDSPNDIDPFTLYGTNFKKYQIERMDGEKVISRSRGFTVDSCVSAVLASQETPEFNGLPTGEKVQAGDDLLCKRATGPDLNKACKQSCADACTDALTKYEERMFAETGYKLEPKERERVLRNCRHSCSYECTKSGKAHDFVVPYRR